MAKINYTIVAQKIDEILKDFYQNNSIIYDGSSESEAFRFGRLKQLKKPIPPKKCIYPNCGNLSIKKSHTIQKSGPLKHISENGFVFGPIRNWRNQEMSMSSIGLKEASTFPGYCKQHEKIFRSFEESGEFKTEQEISLQLYRTVCREIVETEHFIQDFSKNIKVYKEYRDRKLASILKIRFSNLNWNQNLDEFLLREIKNKIIDTELIPLKDFLSKKTKFLSNQLYSLHNGLLKDISLGRHRNIHVHSIRFRDQLPVALATIDIIDFIHPNFDKSLTIIFNVLPAANCTYIYLASTIEQKSMLNTYSSSLHSSINCLNRIESFILGNFHKWFIRPSVWNDLNDACKKAIDEMLNTKDYKPLELPFSILNKWKIIELNKMSKLDNLSPPYIAGYNREIKKLSSKSIITSLKPI